MRTIPVATALLLATLLPATPTAGHVTAGARLGWGHGPRTRYTPTSSTSPWAPPPPQRHEIPCKKSAPSGIYRQPTPPGIPTLGRGNWRNKVGS